MMRPATIMKFFLFSILPVIFLIFLVTSQNTLPSIKEASTVTVVGNITAFISTMRSGPWTNLTQHETKDASWKPEEVHGAMDILNPFGQQASGNKTYDFDDYFDYKDFSEPEIDEQHSLAVIVPFRNAHAELGRFLSHMHTFLRAQNISHVFYIVEQDDSLRFNRGSLINVGFLEAQRDRQSDYFVMHDIDILPLNPRLSYRFDGCAKGPLHLASPSLHPHYSKIDFIGAVLLMTNEQYLKVNGMSNVFWGWGREDEELRIRLRIAGIKIFRPSGVNSTKADSFLHIHNEATRKRDRLIIGDQYKARYRLDTVTGLNTTKYKLLEKVTKELNGVPYAHVRVQLDCNHRATPWCQRQ